MTLLRSALALVLSLSIGLSPAAAQVRPITVHTPVSAAVAAAGAAHPLVLSAATLHLDAPSLSVPALPRAASVFVRPTAMGLAALNTAATTKEFLARAALERHRIRPV